MGDFLVRKFFVAAIAGLSIFTNASWAQTSRPSARASAASAAAPRQVYAVPFVSKTLSNGLEVIVLQDSSVPIVTVELAVRNGSFTESPEFHGLSHLYEHMFFKPNLAIQLRACDSLRERGGTDLSKACGPALSLKSKIGDV